ncbi:nucleolar protein dao-5-like isoform X2 [Liolophura sinensis]|uniref:nucleolar protein dao-5-like isoform X2 n=1 Tax=Liolophura sinensis TaxID=3198878 RepID=UPI0031585B84
METEAEVVAGPSGEQMEEGLDGKNEKKRKFKPFEAMRKFFRASRKRSKLKEEESASIVCVKAKSTSALMSQQIEEEEDDGGFKTHNTLSQARSISEDSIFKPDPKDSKKANIETFTKGAKSVENINQGTPGKSASRDSDKSLLSVGSSDNEEEDLFQTNWKASVASVVTRRSKGAPSTDTGMELDLSAVQPTTALKSDAAKHRISVAPKARRGARQGKKIQLQKKPNSSALPKLPEESPSKLAKEDVIQKELSSHGTKDVAVKPVSKKAGSQEKISVDKPVETPAVSPEPSAISGKPLLKQKLSGEKTEEIVSKSTAPCASAPSSTKSTATEDIKTIDKADEKEKTSSSGVTELSQAFNRLRKTSGKKTEDASQDSDKENISEETVPQKSSDTDKRKPTGKQPLAKTSEFRGSLKTVGLPEKVNENTVSKTSGDNEVSNSKVSENADSQGVTKQALRPTLSAQSDSSVDVGSTGAKRDSIKEESGSRITGSKDSDVQEAETLSSVRASLRPGLKTSMIKETKADAKPSGAGAGAKTFDSKVTFSGELKSTDSSDVSVSVSKDSKVSEGASTDGKGNNAQEKAEGSTVSDAKVAFSSKTNTDGNLGLQRLASPKEEYKQKRQGRSKTLPEPPLAKEVVKSSVQPARNDYDNVTINVNKPQLEENTANPEGDKAQPVDEEPVTKKDGEKVSSSPPSSPARQGVTVITTAAKRPEPKRLSLKGGLVSDSSEPIWVVMARKKKAQEDSKEDKESSDSSKGDESSDSSKTVQTSDTTPGKSATQSSPAKSSFPSSPSKTPFKETKINTKIAPPPEMKSASKPILIENKPPGKVEVEEKSSSTPAPTDSRSVLVSRPAVKFVRNLPPSKPSTSAPPVAVSKPAHGKSFVIDKPVPMTSKPSAETWKVTPAKPEGSSAGVKTGGGSSFPGQKTFTIDKSSLGSSSSSNTAKPAEKKEETKPSSVPAWRSNLQKKKEPAEIKVPEMKKIEIIEKSGPMSPQKPSQTKPVEKSTDEAPVIMREKAKTDKCSDVASARSSKVLDMVKNYQKLQVS